MSSSKRFFDSLGVSNLGGSGNKRARSPADRIPTGNSINLISSTQSTQATCSSQPEPGRTHKAKLAGKEVLAKIKKSLDALQQSCGIFEPVVIAARTLQEFIESTFPEEDHIQDTATATSLAQWATLLTGFLEENQPVRMSTQMENLINVLRQEANRLKKQTEGGSTRLDKWEESTHELEYSRQQVEGALWKLSTEASLNMWKDTDNQIKACLDASGNLLTQESLLDAMLPAHDAVYDSSYADKVERGPCLENTRVGVLDGVRSWMYDQGQTKVYWINGMAGTGKTTIAYTICEELKRNKRLGASFFVSRASSQCQDVSRILPTIAYQLARISYPYRSALCRILNEEPNAGQRKLSVQFEHLIESPLRKVADKLPKGLVVVIDALDECSDPRTTEMIVDMLLQHASNLPVWFFLTSRPDPSIMNTVLSNDRDSGPRSVLHLHNVEEQLVRSDIKTYLSVSLARLKPTGDQIEWLADQAGVLFIYAATLVRYVLATGLGASSTARLRAILAPSAARESKKDRAIDRLYKVILEGILLNEERDEEELTVIKQVLWTVVSVREPVTKTTLATLIEVGVDQVAAALGPLESVIHVFGKNNVISTLHASFPEFVLNPSRSGPLNCDKGVHNQYLAIRCFDIMKDQLRFNICGLTNSYQFDKDVPDIEARIKKAISPELYYACRFWGEHLAQATVCDANFTDLDMFLNHQLLFWMEVLNLKGWIENGVFVLREASSWLTANQKNDAFLNDCLEFFSAYAHHPVNLSTPHIYVSHLPLGPKGKARGAYLKRTRRLVQVEGTAVEKQGVDSNLNPNVKSEPTSSVGSSLVTHNSRIRSIAFPPSGDKVATSSEDGIICVWDACTGSTIACEHIGEETTLAKFVFSPDGCWLASAFSSSPLKATFWNVQTGATVSIRIEKYEYPAIFDACFSPDSTRIAFTATQGAIIEHSQVTLLILDVCTGNTLCELLLPHGAQLVAFSSDGNHVLSSSLGGGIQMWDSYTGTPRQTNSTETSRPDIQRLFIHDSRPGNNFDFLGLSLLIDGEPIALSPQNMRVECGYHYQGITHLQVTSELFLRDNITKELLAAPFGRKDENITTFSFSPDGTRIFSGSERIVHEGPGWNYFYYIRAWNVPEGSANDPMREGWEIDASGWVRNQDSQPVIWVPAEWRSLFPLPPNTLAIGPEGSLNVSMNDLLLGESWTGCYNSSTPITAL